MASAPEEGRDAAQETHARGDRRQAAPGGCPGLARPKRRRRRAGDRRDRGHLPSLAPGVRRAQDRPGQAPEGARDRERPPAPGGRQPHAGQADPQGGRRGKLLSPARRRACVEHVRVAVRVSERRGCRVLGQHRSTQRKPQRGRLWLADGSCVRLRAERPNHVWSYDFVEDRTHDGRKHRMPDVLDEFTHECLATRVARELKAIDVVDALSDLFLLHGAPGHELRSDNGPEFVAEAVQGWITAVGARTAHIAPGSPWENGYVESFGARLRDELLDGEIFYSLREAQVVIESRRRHDNQVRPHASLGYRAPAPEVIVPAFAAPPRPASPATPAVAARPIVHQPSPRTTRWGPANAIRPHSALGHRPPAPEATP